MIKGTIVTMLLLFGLLKSTGLAADQAADPLWRKTIAFVNTNSEWIPGLVVVRSEVLHKGRTEAVHESWERSTMGKKGEVLTETIKVLEDGKDVTAQEKKEKDKQARKAAGSQKKAGSPQGSPWGNGALFDENLQDSVSVKPTGQTRVIANRTCVSYKFEQRLPQAPLTTGVVWLDRENGSPMELENMTFDPLPDRHLKQLMITTRYEFSPDSGWHVKEVITTGVASMLLIKAEFRNTLTFTEYWKKPKRGAVPVEK